MTSTIERNKNTLHYTILKQILHQRFFYNAKDDLKKVEGVDDFIDTERRVKEWHPPYQEKRTARHPDPWNDIPTAQVAYINMTLKVLAHPSYKDYGFDYVENGETKDPRIPKDFEKSMEAYLVQCRFGDSDLTQFMKWEKKWNNLKLFVKINISFDNMLRDHSDQIKKLKEKLQTIKDQTIYLPPGSPATESEGGNH